jgi:PAS domain S-box-containing protein
LSHAKKDVSAVESKCKDIRDTLQKENSILKEMLNETENMHLVYLDRDFNFVRVNEAYAKTCGYKPEEMIGKNHFALYPGEEVEAIFKRVRDTGVPVKFHDKPFAFPDQPERGVTYWDWTLTPVKNEAGEVEGLVFSLVETTERMKAEEALQEQGVAISSAPDAIFSTDSSFLLKSWNKAAERIFGWTAEEVVGKASTLIFNIKYPTLNGVSRKRALKILAATGFWGGEKSSTARRTVLPFLFRFRSVS